MCAFSPVSVSNFQNAADAGVDDDYTDLFGWFSSYTPHVGGEEQKGSDERNPQQHRDNVSATIQSVRTISPDLPHTRLSGGTADSREEIRRDDPLRSEERQLELAEMEGNPLLASGGFSAVQRGPPQDPPVSGREWIRSLRAFCQAPSSLGHEVMWDVRV